MMRFLQIAAAAAAVLVLASPARAQFDGMMAMTTTTRHPVRVAYRIGIDALLRGGWPISMMSLDRVLQTPSEGPDGQPRSMVRLEFERKGNSTQVVVVAAVPDAAGRDVCRTDRCLTQVILIESMVVAKIDTALARYRPLPHTQADSLAAARALGYAPQNPIRVGTTLAEGDRNQRRYLERLRGPRGQPVTYLRLGSCCEFRTPRGHQGTGLLDAYEVQYAGLARPIVLYLDLYTPAPPAQGIPPGFTRGPSPR